MSLIFAFLLTTVTLTGEILLEAEDAVLKGLQVDTSRAGYSGTGYVTGFDEASDTLLFEFEAEAGLYSIRLGYAQASRIRQYEVLIDGRLFTFSITGSGSSFGERSLVEYYLTGGSHTVVLPRGSSSTFDVDYLKLIPVAYEPPDVPTNELSDPEATPSAQKLFHFLKEQYGKSILSGQQELHEVAYVQSITGKEPAIAGGDLVEYSPSRIEHGSNPDNSGNYSSADDLIDWAGEDGIIALMWHWNAPTDLLNTEDQPWWRGFYTEATTFNFAEALSDTTSERYQLLLRDIDAIAVQLKKFQDADIPLLWRPLHEAAGGWFWWGARGAEPFVQLWRLMYDRIVHVHGIHNLIWVYTHEPGAISWYPGDEYVDIVGRDIYANDPAATMLGDWNELQDLYGDRRMIALTESGTLPDPEVITSFGIWWSWFSPWTGDFIRTIDPEFLRQVYKRDIVMTRDELPDWRSLALATEPEIPRPKPEVTIHPNPTSGPAVLRLTMPSAASVSLEVFDLLGRRVQAIPVGYQPAGVLETSINPGPGAGVYLVRIVVGEQVEHRTVIFLP